MLDSSASPRPADPAAQRAALRALAARQNQTLKWRARREALLLAVSAAQTCLLVPWARALSIPVAQLDALALSLFTLSGFVAAMWFVRLTTWLRAPGWLRTVLAIAGPTVAIGFGLTAVLYPGRPAGAVLANLAERILRAESLIIADVVVIGLAIAAWWLGASNVQRLFTVDALRSSLRFGVVVWLMYLIFNTIPSRDPAAPFLAGYFFFSLVALAIARSEDMFNVRFVSRSPFGLRWFTAIVAVALLTVVFSLLAWSDVAPLLASLFWGVIGVLSRVVLLVVVIIGSLFGAFRGEAAPAAIAPPDPQTDAPPAWLEALIETNIDAVTQAAQVVSIVVFAIIFVVLALLIVRLSKRLRSTLHHIDLYPGQEQATSRGLLASPGPPNSRWQHFVRRLQRGPFGWLSELTVRRIYAQTVALGKECGVPRRPSATPYEYLPTLVRLFPGVEVDLELITEAYVRAHYGELPDTPQRLQQVRQAYRRVQTEAQSVIDYNRNQSLKAQEKLKEALRNQARQDRAAGFGE